MLIGYARVSTQDQTLNLQLDALHLARCEKTYTDTASGAMADRKGLQDALDHLRAETLWSCGGWTASAEPSGN